MNKKQYSRSVAVLITSLCLLSALAYSQQRAPRVDRFGYYATLPEVWSAPEVSPNKKVFVFKGKVEQVDRKAQTLVVTNEPIIGWRFAMTATYTVDHSEVLTNVIPGDRVTAKVYAGDFKVLYGLRVIPPDDTPVLFPRNKLR